MPDDSGFTVLELTLSIAILGIVVLVLMLAMAATAMGNRQSRQRLDESSDARISGAYLGDDVAGALDTRVDQPARCGAGQAVVEFSGRTYTPQPDGSLLDRATIVSYVLQVTTQNGKPVGELRRSSCVADWPLPSSATPQNVTVLSWGAVARNLSGTAPAVTCSPLPCGPLTRTVTLTLTSADGNPTAVLTGTRRTS